jgi:sugar transferase EpsL
VNVRPHQQAIKRGLDFVLAALALATLWPLLLCVGLLIRCKMGRPVLFSQQRPGRHGRLFTVYKFRTMSDDRGPDGRLKTDAERLTALGRFLRHFSLDELPQLWNVLCGQMSLVGPRPLLKEYLPRYTPEQARRHTVRPGITGLAQVSGRNALRFSQRLAYDVEYVDNYSLLLDLHILWLTALKVLGNRLEDRAGQDVSAVDDLGLHDEAQPPPAVQTLPSAAQGGYATGGIPG